MKCRPLDTGDKEFPDVCRKMRSPGLHTCWFAVERTDHDLGLLTAKMFYLACALKEEANKQFLFIHLVGEFEGNPSMSRQLRNSRGELIYAK